MMMAVVATERVVAKKGVTGGINDSGSSGNGDTVVMAEVAAAAAKV